MQYEQESFDNNDAGTITNNELDNITYGREHKLTIKKGKTRRT